MPGTAPPRLAWAPTEVAPSTAAPGPLPLPMEVELTPSDKAPNPKAALSMPPALAEAPTAVAPAPRALAWQFALVSKSVAPALPELHPATAAGGSASSPAPSPPTATNASRDHRQVTAIAH